MLIIDDIPFVGSRTDEFCFFFVLAGIRSRSFFEHFANEASKFFWSSFLYKDLNEDEFDIIETVQILVHRNSFFNYTEAIVV